MAAPISRLLGPWEDEEGFRGVERLADQAVHQGVPVDPDVADVVDVPFYSPWW
ncbi:MAG TPA: hypothetical protein VIR62_04950 [Allosphingosinicella sp.]